MKNTVECLSLFGKKIQVPLEKLIFRVAAYGIIIHNQKILLVNNKSTNKLFFPGGAVDLGETLVQALKREVKEETGLNIAIKEFFYFQETFFYYDRTDSAFQNYCFYYFCQPLDFELTEKYQPGYDEAEKPAWYKISELTKEQLQYPAPEVFEKIKIANLSFETLK